MKPVWMNRDATLAKVCDYVEEAAKQKSQLVAFGEALVPGYPFWVDRTGGAEFNSELQKAMFADYATQAVCLEEGHLDEVCRLAGDRQIAVILGVIERPRDRGRHSLYCSLIYISPQGTIESVHRKLVPTYEERLVWSPGDGNGLQVHSLGPFTVGALNCWENWMPLARSAMYALGEDLHVAIWPGSERNTEDITRFIAKESRSFVVSVSGMMSAADVPDEVRAKTLKGAATDVWADGGSCIAAPDGSWVVAPLVGAEGLTVAELDHRRVLEERQNFDAAGHYSRPDVTQLHVNRRRQSTVDFDA
jgi:nitrilase